MGPSVGKYLLLAYLPIELAVAGTRLQVLYVNDRFPVTVAACAAVFDPGNSRMKRWRVLRRECAPGLPPDRATAGGTRAGRYNVRRRNSESCAYRPSTLDLCASPRRRRF